MELRSGSEARVRMSISSAAQDFVPETMAAESSSRTRWRRMGERMISMSIYAAMGIALALMLWMGVS